MRYHIIAHTGAGNGSGLLALNKVESILNNKAIEYKKYISSYPGSSIDIAKSITEKWDLDKNRLIVIGGDGTLHEVVYTLKKLDRKIGIIYIPGGSGNDFNRAWQGDKTVEEILIESISISEPIEVPIFKYLERNTKSEGVVVNAIAFGFFAGANQKEKDVRNLKIFNHIPKVPWLLYLMGALKHLKGLKNYNARVWIEDREYLQEDILDLMISNGPYGGGGFLIDNRAKRENFEFSIQILKSRNIIQAANILLRLVLNISPQNSKQMTYFNTKNPVIIKTEDYGLGQVDGEILSFDKIDMELTLSSHPFYFIGHKKTEA